MDYKKIIDKVIQEIQHSVGKSIEIAEDIRYQFYIEVLSNKSLIKQAFAEIGNKITMSCKNDTNDIILPIDIKIKSMLSNKIIYNNTINKLSTFGWHEDADISVYNIEHNDIDILYKQRPYSPGLPLSRIAMILVPHKEYNKQLWSCVDVGGFWGNQQITSEEEFSINYKEATNNRIPIKIYKNTIIKTANYIVYLSPREDLIEQYNIDIQSAAATAATIAANANASANIAMDAANTAYYISDVKQKWITILNSGLEVAKFISKNTRNKLNN